jgi:hypothetical protein
MQLIPLASFGKDENLQKFDGRPPLKLREIILTLILLTWKIWWAPNNASRWQMGFKLVFKGLK